jgi:NAD(P)H dehydrogenase (quinone)
MKGDFMAKILVLFHSWTGHAHRLAEGVAAGAREIESCEVILKQVPEVVPEPVLEQLSISLAPAATPSANLWA